MANRELVAEVYDYIDELWRITFGETADFSNALYDGKFSKSLEQAQTDKHRYVLEGINFAQGHRILDIGCGWGAMLKAVEAAGGHAVGLTLSTSQAEACRRAGFEVHVLDWRDDSAAQLGQFDAIVCLGAFEHFCSAGEYLAGKQDEVYETFFRLCHAWLLPRARLYLQTQLWSSTTPPYERVSVKAPGGSDEYMMAVIEKMFPDSCFPFSVAQLERVARPYFALVGRKNGRLDYPHTIEEWRRRVWAVSPRKLWVYLKMSSRALVDRDFWYKFQVASRPYYAECFTRGIMDHERLFFESLE